ncbi:MAG: hypothetical protein ACF8Q5_12690 [Phycisphaerales bacterium JB040]
MRLCSRIPPVIIASLAIAGAMLIVALDTDNSTNTFLFLLLGWAAIAGADTARSRCKLRFFARD